jgi:hypothetical protein
MRFIDKLVLACALLLLGSCEKVIELEIRESDAKYVIEGVVTNEAGACKVLLTRSRRFYEDNQFEGVGGARITVADNGVEVSLRETAPGVYETSSINGTPGHTYRLAVTINNQLFTATCTMPQPVLLTDLFVSPGPLGQFKFATVAYNDPANQRGYYRFIQYLNGAKDPAIFWESDEFRDGQAVSLLLDTGVDKKDDPRNIQSGDTVMVEMLCIDPVIYKYWYTLRSRGGVGGTNTVAPADPVTNITGGALGYFSAHTIDRKTVIAP